MSSYTNKQIFFAALTFAIYSYLLSWKIALLIMITVGFHEYSHLFAARKLGMKTKGFFFIPFVGGVALIAEFYKKFSDKAIVLLAGPIGGGVLAAVTALAWVITDIPFLGISAYWMAVVNLFNLVPFSFLDGGQLLGTITNSVNRTLGMVTLTVSTVIGAGVLLKLAPIIGVLVVVLGGASVLKEINNWRYFRKGDFHMVDESYLNPPTSLTRKQILLTCSAWAGAASLLCFLISSLPQSSLLDLLSQ